jgi:adenosylcobinamide-GDP ribazoletransferase
VPDGIRDVLDGLRLALAVFTRVPSGATKVGRRTAGVAMALAPVAGAAVGGVAAAVLTGTSSASGRSTLLPAVLAVVALALASGALHLDGLADTADAFGISGDPVRARAVMKAPEIGAFGVVAISTVLLIDVAAVAQACALHRGTFALVLGAATGRLSATWDCRPTVPAATDDGLGAWVAGSVSLPRAVVATGAVLAVAMTAGGLEDHAGVGGAAQALIAVAAGLIVGELVRAAACRRVGGLTGDVIGAGIECAATAAYVAVAVTGSLVH